MKSLLVIGYVWPEPNSSAAGKRMMDLIYFFQKQNYKVIFSSPAKESEFMLDLNVIDIEQVKITINDCSFNDFISELNPQVVLFDRFMMEEQFGWRVDECCPNALRLLDTEDLHCLRSARWEAHKKQRSVTNADYLSDKAKREIASIFRCDLSLMISHVEMDLLTNFFQVPKQLLHQIPFLIEKPTQYRNQKKPSYEERNHFISIGNFHHRPNWDAVLQLKNNFWPEISKRLPNAKMFIYGAYMPEKAKQLHNEKQRFYVLGRATDVREVMHTARLCLAPIRFGAGIKGKLLDAMLFGTPSVTTLIGAESMHAKLPWGGAIAITDKDFISSAVELYSNKQKWLEAQMNGFTILETLYDEKPHTQILLTRIDEITENLEQHRERNFIGAMLRHSYLKSTEYMSRWIEEKNKK